MATLKHIVDQLADSLNRPFDGMLKSRLKELVMQEFALYVSRSIDKYGVDKEFIYSFHITDLTLVDGTIAYLETTNVIPTPLRYNSNTPFIYVGTEDGDYPFSYYNAHSKRFVSYLPNVGAAPFYDYVNGKIRIWNYPTTSNDDVPPVVTPLANLLVQLVPTDRRVSTTPDVVKDFFLNDDAECPITQDLVNQIKVSLLKGELLVTDEKDKVEATHLDNN